MNHGAYNATPYRPSLTQHEADLIALAQRVRVLEKQGAAQASLTFFLTVVVLVLASVAVFR